MNLRQLVENSDFDHSKYVAKISTLMAEKAGFSQSEVSVIEQAALYHDIGKSSIPLAILNKPGKLTPQEFELVRTHTAIGFQQIMDAVHVLSIASIVAREHHEREDGTGYMCLPGSDIHPYAKLISVADVFDALASRRAYKEPWSIADICDYFREGAGKQFDACFVNLLLGLLEDIKALYRQPT